MPSLLDLPRETRDRIYRHLLVKDSGSSQAMDITNTISLNHYPCHLTKWCSSSYTLVNVGSTAILRTCKRIAEEGAAVLYGSSTISCNPDDAFYETFLPTIGPFNSACIRSLYLQIDKLFGHDPISKTALQFEEKLHDSTSFLVNILSRDLSQLQDLVLTNPPARYYYLNLDLGLPSSKIWWMRASCSMLWVAAWTTIRHPGLKRADWSQRWITRYTPDAEEDLQYLDISVRISAPRTKWGTQHFDEFEELRWYVRHHLLAKGLPLLSVRGITLDSRAIRRQGLGGLKLDYDPLSYGTAAAAITSEEGRPRGVLEELSDRFGYKKVKYDKATCNGWGDLKRLDRQRLASKNRNEACVVGKASVR